MEKLVYVLTTIYDCDSEDGTETDEYHSALELRCEIGRRLADGIPCKDMTLVLKSYQEMTSDEVDIRSYL